MEEIIKARQPLTLPQIVDALQFIETDEASNLTKDDLVFIRESLETKIEAYRKRMDMLAAESEVEKKYANEHAEKSARLQKDSIKMEWLLKSAMAKLGVDQLGTAKRRTRTSIVVKQLHKPGPESTYLYPGMVRTKYEWDKPAIKEMARDGNEKAMGLIEESITISIKWD